MRGTESSMAVVRGWEEGRTGSCLMSTKFPLCETTMSPELPLWNCTLRKGSDGKFYVVCI